MGEPVCISKLIDRKTNSNYQKLAGHSLSVARRPPVFRLTLGFYRKSASSNYPVDFLLISIALEFVNQFISSRFMAEKLH